MATVAPTPVLSVALVDVIPVVVVLVAVVPVPRVVPVEVVPVEVVPVEIVPVVPVVMVPVFGSRLEARRRGGSDNANCIVGHRNRKFESSEQLAAAENAVFTVGGGWSCRIRSGRMSGSRDCGGEVVHESPITLIAFPVAVTGATMSLTIWLPEAILSEPEVTGASAALAAALPGRAHSVPLDAHEFMVVLFLNE